jgi:hypothetical protein
MHPEQSWYRNAGCRAYHLARRDWVFSGKAVCGTDIAHPGFVADSREDLALVQGRRACKHCDRIAED